MTTDTFLIALGVLGVLAVAVLFLRREHRTASAQAGLVIGPWISGKTRSKGYPMRLDRQGKGWVIHLKQDGQINAVLDYEASIPAGALKLIWHYRADVTSAQPVERPDAAPLVSLVLQREGDDWSGEGERGSYRLYSPAFPLESGEQSREIPLTGWTNVWGQPADMGPVLSDLSNVAVAFGHSSGRMHGVSGAGTFSQISLEAI
ncbi:hypothetical protein FHS52_001133 [Erythromicrobium ramosum]|uniref:DUF3047 domain-containing protein n=1 Tax=Erythrobacter ramosus TaxID=35811 RepID=A0A6I4UI48_9SPHN|nr:hypothetical protein [Erythrobacter ramosus]MBB3775190.1 hypothetical protein [Erythrobacter ramosus]MXP37185.1 hypothetical protein [Erythrobacter ramosus]